MITEMEYAIRKYTAADRDAVRALCVNTALGGSPLSLWFDDCKLAADILISPYIDFEPASCFVAESGGSVIGYVAGCVDSGARWRKTLLYIVPPLLLKAAVRRVLFRKKTLLLCQNIIKSFFGGEFFTPDFAGAYPSCLHVNVDGRFRSAGVGAALLDRYIAYLEEKGVPGVMLETRSAKAAEFFKKSGFSVLYSRGITYLDYTGLKGVRLYIMGRKLDGRASDDLH